MRIIYTLLLVVLLTSCSQTTEFSSLVQRNGKFYQVNSQTPYSGTFVKSSPNKKATTVLMEGAIKDGYFDGEIKEYYPNGQLKKSTTYKNQKLHGKNSKYYSNGQLELVEHYNANVLNGERKSFKNNGTPVVDEYYENGVRDRGFVKYDAYGKVIELGNYTKGIKVGSWSYVKNNQKITETYDEKGQLHGAFSQTYKSAALPAWIDGQQRTKAYVMKGNYAKGNKDGVWEISEKGGRVVQQLTYKNGKPMFFEGEWFVHDTKNNSKYFLKYDNGNLYSKTNKTDAYKMIGNYKIDDGRNYLTIGRISYRYGLLKKDEYRVSSNRYIAKKI